MAWRRTEQSLEPLVRYRRQLDAAVDQLLATREVARRWEALARSAHGRPTSLLLISSERGLCGPFNSRLVSFALDQAKSLTANGTQVQLLCLGRQGKRLLEEAGRPLLYTRSLPSLSAPGYADVEAVTLDLLGFIEEGTSGDVLAIHHVPFQRFQYRPQVTPLFPIPFRATEQRGSRLVVRPADDLEPFMVHLLTEQLLVNLYATVLHLRQRAARSHLHDAISLGERQEPA